MIESFKRFRKRRLSNDAIIALFALGACRKATSVDEIAHLTVMKIKDNVETKSGNETSGNEDASLSVDLAPTYDGEFVLNQHPMEPTVVDHPIRCPHPEHGVHQDGRALKERVPSIKRKGQLPFLTESQAQKLLWKRRMAPSDCQIFPAASAPEASFLKFLP